MHVRSFRESLLFWKIGLLCLQSCGGMYLLTYVLVSKSKIKILEYFSPVSFLYLSKSRFFLVCPVYINCIGFQSWIPPLAVLMTTGCLHELWQTFPSEAFLQCHIPETLESFRTGGFVCLCTNSLQVQGKINLG